MYFSCKLRADIVMFDACSIMFKFCCKFSLTISKFILAVCIPAQKLTKATPNMVGTKKMNIFCLFKTLSLEISAWSSNFMFFVSCKKYGHRGFWPFSQIVVSMLTHSCSVSTVFLYSVRFSTYCITHLLFER